MQIDMCTCIHVSWLCVCTHKHTNIILAASTWGPSALEPCQCLHVVLTTPPSILKTQVSTYLWSLGYPVPFCICGNMVIYILLLFLIYLLFLFSIIICYYYCYYYCYWVNITIILNDYQQAPPNVTVQHRQGHRVGDVFIFDLRQEHAHSHARKYTSTCTPQTNN